MKKLIALTVVLCMALSLGVFASDTEALEAAVMKVKSVTEIPEELTEFEYHLSKENGVSVWNLNWNDKDYKVGSLSATVTETGDILDFYRHSYSDYKRGETIDIEEAIETAKLYGKTIMKEDFAKMQLTNEKTIPQDSYGDYFIIKFGRFENGIPVSGQTCEVGINKYTSVFETYSGFEFDRETVYPLPENVLSQENALSKFTEQLGAQLQYRMNYKYKTGETTVFPAYFLNDDQYCIDAFTGEKVEIVHKAETYKENYLMNSADMSATMGAANLSPQEQEAVDKLGTLLSQSEAADILESKIDIFAEYELVGSYLGKNGKDKYVINLRYSDEKDFFGNAAIDAQTGEILNFYFSDSSAGKVAKKLTEEEKTEKVTEFAESLAGEKFKTMVPAENEKSISFVRQVNGTEFVGNGISIGYDDERDIIYSYSLTWNDIESFPDISEAMSEQDVIGKIADNIGYELCYIGEKLVYVFEGQAHSIFSPYTGNPLKYDGSEYIEEKQKEYNDISGHWCERTVKKLLENNIGFAGESFLPDNAVTQRDFVKLVFAGYGLETDEDVEECIKNRKLFENVNLDGTVTRNDAARVFSERLGLSEIAAKPEVFAQPFNDCTNTEAIGFVAVCKAFGIITGDGDGNYRGEDSLTRAESAAMLYKFMCR